MWKGYRYTLTKKAEIFQTFSPKNQLYHLTSDDKPHLDIKNQLGNERTALESIWETSIDADQILSATLISLPS